MNTTVVVGAGVVGLASALALRKRGDQVILIDQDEPGRGCSAGNTGWVVPSFSTPLPEPGLVWRSLRWMLRSESPLYIAPAAAPRLAPWLWRFWRHCNPTDYAHGLAALAVANRTTMELYDSLARDGVHFETGRHGVLFVFLSEDARRHAVENFRALASHGYQMPESMTSAELAGFEPALGEVVRAGLWFETERQVRPETLTAGLARRLRELGVEIRSRTRAIGGLRRGNRLEAIRTADGEISATRFVLAAGAWSGPLARTIGARLPVQAGKGYSITVPITEPLIRRPLYLGEAHVALTQFEGAIRLAGTMELSGINQQVDTRRINGIRAAVRHYLRLPDAVVNGGTEWAGMRPITPDGLPLIGRLPGFDNVFVATGHGMLGVTLAPVTAEIVAALVTGNPVPAAAAPFDPARFG